MAHSERPFSNVICLLYRLDWKPRHLNVWDDHDGGTWIWDNEKTSTKILVSILSDKYNADALPNASHHYCGEGLEHGIDYRNTMAWLRSKDISYMDKCTLKTIMSVACGPQFRVHQIHPEISQSGLYQV